MREKKLSDPECDTEKPKQIEYELGILFENMNYLAEKIQILEDIISPTLRQYTHDKSESEKSPMEELVPLAQKIKDATIIIVSLSKKVNIMIEGCEL